MSFSVGIIGLPNAGKSTLFKALTKKAVDIAPYPFTTISPNAGVVAVPDERLEKIAKVINPEKTTPTIIEFVDIAGLVRGAHKGEGLGNQFLSQIRSCDALLEIVRAFKNPDVEHIEKAVIPENDIEIIKTELLMKDLEVLENLVLKLEKEAKSKEKDAAPKLKLFRKIKEDVCAGKMISRINLTDEEKKELKELQLLTQKPIFYILNTGYGEGAPIPEFEYLALNLKEESEISELSESEAKELNIKSGLDKLITACYNILDLITFYTIAGFKEARAWTLKTGLKAPRAGREVHTDFETKFIRAEVIGWQDLIKAGSWAGARESGLIKTAGKDYIVQDGDIMEFKI